MKHSDLIFGQLAPFFSYTIVLVILLLMFVVSLRLFLDRRKKAYFSMTISLVILIIHYGLLIYFEESPIEHSSASYITLLLRTVSFVLVNMGIYQLYNRTKRRHYFFFYGLIALGLLISLLHFYIPVLYQGTAQQVKLLQDLGLELYPFVLIFLFFYMIPPRIAQHGKYQLALTLYFCNQIAHILNVYMFAGTKTLLSLLENVLPIAFYFLLFLLLFERVVELIQAIYNSSITDGLTRLYNRKYFYNSVSQCVQQHLPVSVLFSDIDNFKKLNDMKGHQMGDETLKQVAQILKDESEDCGIAGRYGGEEMVVLVTDPSVKMDDFAERIRKRVEEETNVTVSLGYCKWKSGLTAEQLIRQADEAMYTAKKTGKNKVMRYGT